MLDRAADIARFYTSLTRDVPYPSFTVALVENEQRIGQAVRGIKKALTKLG